MAELRRLVKNEREETNVSNNREKQLKTLMGSKNKSQEKLTNTLNRMNVKTWHLWDAVKAVHRGKYKHWLHALENNI